MNARGTQLPSKPRAMPTVPQNLATPLRWTLAFSITAALLFWALQGQRPYAGSLALKLVPLLALIPALWAYRASLPVRLILAALCCHMVGDALMEWDRKRLLLAIGPFMAGHVLLALAWWYSEKFSARWAAFTRAALTLGTLAMLALLLPRLQGPLQLAVPVYVVALLSMAWLAQSTGQAAIAMGALSYVVSDGIIAWSALVAPLPGELYLSWPTYYAAQLAMVSGALWQARRGAVQA